MNPELADRLDALTAERLRPVPPQPHSPLPVITPERAAANLRQLREASRVRISGRRTPSTVDRYERARREAS